MKKTKDSTLDFCKLLNSGCSLSGSVCSMLLFNFTIDQYNLVFSFVQVYGHNYKNTKIVLRVKLSKHNINVQCTFNSVDTFQVA